MALEVVQRMEEVECRQQSFLAVIYLINRGEARHHLVILQNHPFQP